MALPSKSRPNFLQSPLVDKGLSISTFSGCVFGLSIVSLKGMSVFHLLPSDQAKFQLLGLVVLSCVSGLVAVAADQKVSPSFPASRARQGRLGICAGGFCSLAGAGALAFSATLDALGAKSTTLDLTLRTQAWLTLAAGIASFLPCVLCGFAGGLMGSCFVNTSQQKPADSPSVHPSPGRKWPRYVTAVIGIVALASPICLLIKAPVVDPPPPAPIPAPPPPEFRYEPPVGIGSAKPGEIQPDFTKTISQVQSSCPMAMSPDCVLIAFGDSSGPGSAITVYDLHRFTKIASMDVPAYPAGSLTWSPDQKSVACVIGEGAARRIWILNVRDAKAIELPRPPGRDVPGGELYWWHKDELAFFPEDEAPLAFDLTKLLLTPLTDSPRYKELDSTAQKKWMDGARSPWPGQSGWKLGLRTLITSAVPPARRNPEEPWELLGVTIGAYEHLQLPLAYGFRSLKVEEDERIVCSPDGSKIAHLRDDKIEVTYMKKAASPDLMIEVEMSQTPEEVAKNGWSSRVDSKELYVMICAPLKNPLNYAVVGPDYQQVHGIARLHEWKGRKAVFVLPVYDGSIRQDDVVSTLHSWYSGKMSEWKAPGTSNWWAPIRFISAPLPEEIGEVEMPQLLSLAQEPASLRVTKAVAKPRPTPPPKTPEPPVIAPPPVVVTEQDVRAFLSEHHAKASRGDVSGVIADYAPTVDFLSKGRIARTTIEADELAQRKKWPKGSEQVVGPIRLTEQHGTWTANYTIEFYNENAAGEWHRGKADLVMVLQAEDRRLSIISQKAEIYDVTDSKPVPPKPPTAPPTQGQALRGGPITVPRPCFVMVTRPRELPQVEFTDQISFAKGIVWHRTYRELSADGKILRTCRAIYEANNGGRVDRNTATFRIGVQGWDQNLGGGTFTGVCSKSARSLVGRTFDFQFVPGGMVENMTGMVFQRVE